MPTLGRFCGIVIIGRYGDHAPPHVHVKYGDSYEVTYDLRDVTLLKGRFPNKQKRLVEKWLGIHREVLLKMWEEQSFYELPPL